MPNDIDAGHFEFFFFLLAGIIFLDVLIFIFIARSYHYVDPGEEKPFIVKYQNKEFGESVNLAG